MGVRIFHKGYICGIYSRSAVRCWVYVAYRRSLHGNFPPLIASCSGDREDRLKV